MDWSAYGLSQGRAVCLAKSQPHGPFSLFQSNTRSFAFATDFFFATLTTCGCTTHSTSAADLQPNDSNMKSLLPGNFRFQAVEQGAGKLFNMSALKARQMEMIDVGFRLIKMLLAVQVHEIEFVNQA